MDLKKIVYHANPLNDVKYYYVARKEMGWEEKLMKKHVLRYAIPAAIGLATYCEYHAQSAIPALNYVVGAMGGFGVGLADVLQMGVRMHYSERQNNSKKPTEK